MTLHDVVRDFVRRELSLQRLVALNGLLVDAIAIDLPAADLLGAGAPAPTELAWWKMDRTNRYQWDHLIKHLLDAGRQSDAERVAGDLRWVGARLQGSGPAAPAADLSLVGTPRTDRLLAVLTRTAHLLARTEPAGAVVDVLHSRVAGDPDWGPQAIALRDLGPFPRLVNRWPLPDLPDAALRRVLAGHTGWVTAVALAPDGSWLATGDEHGTVLIWDAATGRERATLTGHDDWVNAVAVAPDGSWLVTGGHDGVARIWDPVTGQVQATLCRNDPATPVAWVNAVAVAPDGSWPATAGTGGTIRIWDPVTGQVQATLTAQADIASQGPQLLDQWRCSVNVMSVAPDGSWLATGGHDGTVRIFEVDTGRQWATLSHGGRVTGLAVAPDSSWLAITADREESVRIWDAARGRERAIPTGFIAYAMAVAPDGSWLATGDNDWTVRIWDTATGRQRASLSHHDWVHAMAIAPDGRWLATGGEDGTLRIWDPATGSVLALMRVEHVIHACAWLGEGGLAVVGEAGLYVFDFLPSLIPRPDSR
jgi:WD40 repeat protein